MSGAEAERSTEVDKTLECMSKLPDYMAKLARVRKMMANVDRRVRPRGRCAASARA